MKANKTILSIALISAVALIGAIVFQETNDKCNQIKYEEHLFGELNPNAPLQTKQLDKLIGKWKCVSEDVLPDSTVYQSKAEWTFKYTLGGFAIEDIWIEKKKDSTKNTIKFGRDFMGKNIRIFNPMLNKWQCVWIDNRNNSISSIWDGRYYEEKFIMNDSTDSWKIVFYQMKNDSFEWKYEVRKDNKWTRISSIHAKRIQ